MRPTYRAAMSLGLCILGTAAFWVGFLSAALFWREAGE